MQEKEYIVRTGNRLTLAGLAFLAVSMTCAIGLVIDVVFSAATALVCAGLMGALFAFLWCCNANCSRSAQGGVRSRKAIRWVHTVRFDLARRRCNHQWTGEGARMSQTEQPQAQHGTLSAEISNGVVGIVREYTGRGPTKARTTITDELVVVVMGETLLKAEKSLIEAGDPDTVMTTRRKFQAAMRDDFISLVEGALGRRVVAFLSDHHLDPDVAVEVFLLEPVADSPQPEVGLTSA